MFVTASITETQGLTVIEAMAASLPVICASDDSFKNVVIDDLNGYLFKGKRQYKKCVEELLSNEEKRKYMARQARISSNTHSLKYFAESALDVYKCAIDRKEKSGFFKKIKNTLKGDNDDNR